MLICLFSLSKRHLKNEKSLKGVKSVCNGVRVAVEPAGRMTGTSGRETDTGTEVGEDLLFKQRKMRRCLFR